MWSAMWWSVVMCALHVRRAQVSVPARPGAPGLATPHDSIPSCEFVPKPWGACARTSCSRADWAGTLEVDEHAGRPAEHGSQREVDWSWVRQAHDSGE